MGMATRLMRRIPDQLGRPGGADAGKEQPLRAALGRVEGFVRTDMGCISLVREPGKPRQPAQLPRPCRQIQAIPSKRPNTCSFACMGLQRFFMQLEQEDACQATGEALAN